MTHTKKINLSAAFNYAYMTRLYVGIAMDTIIAKTFHSPGYLWIFATFA